MITVGVLGAGGMGNVHARQYRKMADVDLRFYEPDADRAKTYVERWQATPCASVEELMSVADVVDVCLPTHMHAELVLKSIAAGRATFVEKPMAGTLADAEPMVSAADKAGVPFMPGQVVRFFRDFARGQKLVADGKVGTPAAARVRRGGKAPSGSDGWFMDHARSGGVLIDLAVHDFDWLRWTLGEVKHLYARSLGAKTGKGPDYALTTLTYESGAIAHCETTWMDPSGFRTTFEVCGSGGMIQHDSRTNQSLRVALNNGTAAMENPLDGRDDPYYLELRGFLGAVQAGTPPPVSGLDGFMALSTALAALESAKTDKVVVPARHI